MVSHYVALAMEIMTENVVRLVQREKGGANISTVAIVGFIKDIVCSYMQNAGQTILLENLKGRQEGKMNMELANPLSEEVVGLIKQAIERTEWQIESEYYNPEGASDIRLSLLQDKIDEMNKIIKEKIILM
jgi:hypothetical protein